MDGSVHGISLEDQIAQWRSYLNRRQAIHSVDVAELEDHLREQVEGLTSAGLATDEAFLVAVKRMGDLDTLSREFAREHSDRLWKQLVVSSSDTGGEAPAVRKDALVAFSFAVLAGIAVKTGIELDLANSVYVRNMSFVVLPMVAGYFAWKRQLQPRLLVVLGVVIGGAMVFANVYPHVPEGSTEILMAIHLPIALWLAVGLAYAGDRWRQGGGRMDFIRFTGELLIYYALIALGGGVLVAFMAMIFEVIGVDMAPFFGAWMPSMVVGAVIVAGWLVEAKQSVIENMAPVLTRLFTPLFTAVLLAFLATLLWTGRGINIERNALLAFDALLILVLALLLYSISARDAAQPAGVFDVLQVVLVASALVANAVALWAIAARITEWGFTANRVAVLGVNLILLVNLAWSAVLYVRFLRGREAFGTLEKWQTDYLPVYGAWAALVVIVFPPLFGFA